jgi:hypothetical protein
VELIGNAIRDNFEVKQINKEKYEEGNRFINIASKTDL